METKHPHKEKNSARHESSVDSIIAPSGRCPQKLCSSCRPPAVAGGLGARGIARFVHEAQPKAEQRPEGEDRKRYTAHDSATVRGVEPECRASARTS